MTSLDFIMAVEGGTEMTQEEYVSGMQRLIDSGTILHLQGSWQRAAAQLLEYGLCVPPGQRTEAGKPVEMNN
jgi:hypothetical protein